MLRVNCDGAGLGGHVVEAGIRKKQDRAEGKKMSTDFKSVWHQDHVENNIEIVTTF